MRIANKATVFESDFSFLALHWLVRQIVFFKAITAIEGLADQHVPPQEKVCFMEWKRVKQIDKR